MLITSKICGSSLSVHLRETIATDQGIGHCFRSKYETRNRVLSIEYQKQTKKIENKLKLYKENMRKAEKYLA